MRDVEDLTPEALSRARSIDRVDLLILFGCSVLTVAERGAEAMRLALAKKVMTVGGIGHSTPFLWEAVRRDHNMHAVECDGRPEAHIFRDLAARVREIDPASILVEDRSRNTGENAVFARDLLSRRGLNPRSVLLMQDPTMQRRADATFRSVWRDQPDVEFLNFAAVVPRVIAQDGRLDYDHPPPSRLWPMDRFVSLVLGEIPRLRDDADGYGPKGKGFLVHVDIPDDVLAAHDRLVTRIHGESRSRALP